MAIAVRPSILLALVLASTEAGLLGAAFSDSFAKRESIDGVSGTLEGSNVSASVEPSEPRHGGKRGGHSVWVSWTAPSNGLLTLTTEGSSFDTVVAAYTLDPKVTPPLAGLHESGESDDRDSDDMAELKFSVQAGVEYEIAVDGYAGRTGSIRLQWSFAPSGGPLPVIIRRPTDRTVRLGDTLILTVDIRATEEMELRWMKGSTPISGAESPNLVIKNFKAEDVGQYRLRIEQDDVLFFSPPIEVEINSEGLVGTLARNKFEDAWDSGLFPSGVPPIELAGGAASAAGPGIALADIGTGVTRGYNGSQIFNTAYATRDPSEPVHCNVPGGASYWFSYQPPASGTMILDTDGSSFDTLLEVYTYDPPLTGYSDLHSLGCDDNSGSNGLTSKLEFDAEAGKLYFVVVDGVNGARGIAHLNYRLITGETNIPGAPVINQTPPDQLLAAGTAVALRVGADGADPLQYQWFMNEQPLPGQTNATFTLVDVQAADVGEYRAEVFNDFGLASSDIFHVDVLAAPLTYGPDTNSPNTMVVAFPASRGLQYRVEWAPLAFSDTWSFARNVLTDPGGLIWVTNSLDRADARFFRIRKP